MTPTDAAIAVYAELWESLRAEAEALDRAARQAKALGYPLTAAKDHHGAETVRRYAAIAHRARYAEMTDPEPVAR